jgi:hypothetical protein
MTEKTRGCLCGKCTSHRRPDPIVFGCACTCAKRHIGLNLLLTNRQIFSEAACIFYQNNTFCFDNGYLLVGFLGFLRPELRGVIRHISLLGPARYDSSSRVYSSYSTKDKDFSKKIWDGLASCSSLRTLKIRMDHIGNQGSNITQLCQGKDIKVTIAEFRQLLPSNYSDPKLDGVWIEIEEALPKTHKGYLTRREIHKFRLAVELSQEAARLKLLDILRDTPKNITVDLSPLEVSVKMPLLTHRKVVLWGLPSTTATRIRMLKEERRDDAHRIKKGLLTRRNGDMQEEREAALKAKKQALTLKEIEDLEKDLRKIQEKRANLERERQLAERTDAETREEELETNMRIANETKKNERRRVSDK